MKRMLGLVALGLIGLMWTPVSTAQGNCYTQYEGIHQFTFSDALVVIHDHLSGQTDTVFVTGPTTILATAVGDTDGDGREELHTEMLLMQLVGVSSVFGAVKVSESPVLTTEGFVEELAPGICFPALSFFDVFIETETPVLAHNDAPVHMQTILQGIPPPTGEAYVGPTGETDLHAGASHPPDVPQPEILVAHIEHAKHWPTPPPPGPCDLSEPPVSGGPPGGGGGFLGAAPLLFLVAAGATRGPRRPAAVALLALAAVGLGASTFAAADPKGYGPAGDGLTAVCFEPGHIIPDQNGQAALVAFDMVNNPVSGTYCQDLDDDLLCGEPDLGNLGQFQEPRVRFCASVAIEAPLVPGSRSPPQWAVGNNWDPSKTVAVFMDGPVNGGIWSNGGAGNPCQTFYSAGLVGGVNHT